MFAKYYQDELAWLREMGAELSAAHPEMARFLGEPGADPDVERLLEGFAFLTGRIRQKLDDEFPELTHGLMDMFCPHYLRPIPAMAILQVKPKPNMNTAGTKVPRGTLVESTPVDGTRCRFRTAAELQPAPVELRAVELTASHPPRLRLTLRPRARQSYAALANRALRLHLTGDAPVARALFVALCHHVKRVVIAGAAGTARQLDVTLRPAGLDDAEAALPMPPGSFRGFRLLQEYFAFPERFLFVELRGLEVIQEAGEVQLDLEFQQLPENMPPVSASNLLLDCVPIVNLFDHDADPVRAQAGRTEYRIRPAGKNTDHYEVFSVETVEGRVRGATEQQTYRPFYSFGPQDRAGGRFYEVRRRESLRGIGTDMFLRLGATDPEQWADLDTISIDLVCSNRDLPTRLRPGDIGAPTTSTPQAFEYRSIGAPSAPVPPPVGDEVHWRLLSHMTLDLRRLLDRESLCTALALYDFRSRIDRQARRRLDNLLSAISRLTARRGIELLDGAPVPGTDLELVIDEEKVGGEGEAYLFGTILSQFLAQYVSLNSFCRLRVVCSGNQEIFTWPVRIGRKITL